MTGSTDLVLQTLPSIVEKLGCFGDRVPIVMASIRQFVADCCNFDSHCLRSIFRRDHIDEAIGEFC
jgi:hypothetical protein